jgi:predicted ATPase
VPLASLTDPQLVLDSVSRTLDVPEQAGGDVGATLRETLAGRRALLVLDNLEHLLPAAADAVAVLVATEGPTLLTTSRERLRLEGEHTYPVAPLDEPDGVELFSRRAAAAGWTGAGTTAVAELCAQLDNLPLALELAAARASLLEPAEMLTRLGGRLDRLKGARNTDPRQQTLRATIDWSYDLLDPHEQELFAWLAVMAGGATLDSIEEVCDADLDTLQALLDKSLVRRTGDRYWMLETIREYATERLEASGEADRLRARHLEHFEELARGVAPPAVQRDQPATLARLDAELQNFRAALSWAATSRRLDAGGRLASELGWFWEARGHLDEAVRWLSAFAEDPAVDPSVRAPALFWLARLRLWTAEWHAANAHLEEAVRLSRDAGLPGTLAISLGKRGWIASHQGRPLQEASSFVDEAVATARPWARNGRSLRC